METKAAVASVGVWGSIIALVTPIIQYASSGALGPEAAAIISGGAALISLYGRLKAKKQITGIFNAAPSESGL